MHLFILGLKKGRKTHPKKPTRKPTRSFKFFKNFGYFECGLCKKYSKNTKIGQKSTQICSFARKLKGLN